MHIVIIVMSPGIEWSTSRQTVRCIVIGSVRLGYRAALHAAICFSYYIIHTATVKRRMLHV